MRIAFVVERFGYYKFYGPVITEALRRGWGVTCWHNYQMPRTGRKGYLFPDIQRVPSFGSFAVDLYTYSSENELSHLVVDSAVDAIVGLTPKIHIFPSTASAISCPFVTLQTGLDTFLYGSPSDLGTSDATCLYSRFWMDWAAEYFAAQGDGFSQDFQIKFVPKIVVTGSPELDAVSDIDPYEIRKRWNIPKEQPVVLLIPITLSNQHGSWPRIFAAPNRVIQLWRLIQHRGYEHWPLVKHGWNDGALTTIIQRFCDRNDAFLMVKGRIKDPVRLSLVTVAQKVLYDESDYPATVLEALSTSDLCIHFYSTGVLEAAFIGCYSLCIDRPAFDSEGRVPLYTKMWRHGTAGHVYNYKGVSDWWTIPEAIEDLPKKSLGDFGLDLRARREYVQKFLGYGDGQSSKRILDVIQGLVHSR